jgi:hypothetical protein
VAFIAWRKFKSYSKDREYSTYQDAWVPQNSPDLLLQQILAMPHEGRQPISYDEGMNQFAHASTEHCLAISDSPDFWTSQKFRDECKRKCAAFNVRMIDWIGERGFYIELRGDEYQVQGGALQ